LFSMGYRIYRAKSLNPNTLLRSPGAGVYFKAQ
jgi:hypothetical protein